MSDRKMYAVLLTDGAAEELGESFSVFLKSNGDDMYIRAKLMEAEGNYLHLTVDQQILPGNPVEVTLQIPHEFIKASVCATEAEINELGYP
jgi:hypothetical protein